MSAQTPLNEQKTRYLKRVESRRYIHSGEALARGGFNKSKDVRVEEVEVVEG